MNGGELAAKGLGYVLDMLGVVGFSSGLGAIGLPVLIALISSMVFLLIATIVTVVMFGNYSAEDAVFDTVCGILLALTVISGVNAILGAIVGKVLKGTVKNILDLVGASLGVSAFMKLHNCSSF